MEKKEGLTVLSLFDGMSCAQIALREAGIAVERYYASEVDKYAIQQTQHNFPDTIQLGDVTKWMEWDLDWGSIDLICAGSPCQGFSFAGKQLAFNDPRSKLFFVFVEILEWVRKFNSGVRFLLENVDMKREHMKVINDFTGVFAVNINSNRVSAQNRNRWYWSNIRTRVVGLFGEIHTDIPQPADRGILLRDILEDEVEEKYYISDAVMARVNRKEYSQPQINPEKTGALNTKNNFGQMSLDSGTTFVIDVNGKPKPNQGKASCFTAGGNSGGNHSDMDLIATTNYLQAEGGFDSDNRFWYDDGKHASVLTRGEAKTGVVTKNRIRRLTPTECSRLQTVPAWYKWVVSDTQQYRMLGNGWTIEVIKHIFSFIKQY